MRLPKWLIICMVAVAFPAHSATMEELEERNTKDTASPSGKEYEKKAVQAFWSDVSFMRKCAPPAAPIAKSLLIYFEVKNNGTLGQLEITPKTKVASCIAKYVQQRVFPQPPSEFVVKIKLDFKK